ncbi:hypothetical protein Y1Q_0005216 [Alligator mississippiensis]|uniref:Uncharacterized protein n=1 Tax=Alligator mississippiensis TaxID=8496 RepID=A0A151MT15_ALLMI|nr:hypothetical protein Y1Q_0005216 [Alligator mississippiensis]
MSLSRSIKESQRHYINSKEACLMRNTIFYCSSSLLLQLQSVTSGIHACCNNEYSSSEPVTNSLLKLNSLLFPDRLISSERDISEETWVQHQQHLEALLKQTGKER